jgi:alkylated DNA repair dioxygenase AlkB
MTTPSADYDHFTRHQLDDGSAFFVGELPEHLRPDRVRFEELWGLHPDEHHIIRMLGREVRTPRWQQAYGIDYRYTGQTNRALPIPPALVALLDWSRRAIDGRLNGLLLNWYDGRFRHYIGPHHDSPANMVAGAPIVTISFGEERIFRLSHPARKVARDFPARDGTVFILPYDTNRVWKHAVPWFARYRGRRISVTLRAFEPGEAVR